LEVLPKPTELVEADQVIAQQRNIFGEVIGQYRAPRKGIVIGKSVNPVAQTGARILNLGAIATPDNHFFHTRIEDKTPEAPTLEHLAIH
jgi:predicted deacylase